MTDFFGVLPLHFGTLSRDLVILVPARASAWAWSGRGSRFEATSSADAAGPAASPGRPGVP